MKSIGSTLSAHVARGPDGQPVLELAVPAESPDDALLLGASAWKAASQDRLEGWVTRGIDVMAADAGRPSPLESTPDSNLEDDLLWEIYFDPVTGFAKRELFLHELVEVLNSPASGDNAHTLLMIDADIRSATNRSGAESADDVLVAMAQRISATLRQEDRVARLGATRFGIFLRDLPASDAVGVAKRVIGRISAPMRLLGGEIMYPASVGIALAAPDHDSDDLFHDAEVALHHAWERGPAQVFVRSSDVSNPNGRDFTPASSNCGRNPDILSYVLIMQRATVAANECATLEEAAHVVLQQVCAHTGLPLGHLSAFPPVGQEGVARHVWYSEAPKRHRRFQQQVEQVPLPWRVEVPAAGPPASDPIWMVDFVHDDTVHAAAGRWITSAFAFPVRVGREVVGILEFFTDDLAFEMTPLLNDVLLAVGTQLGRVAERERTTLAVASS